MKIGLIWKNWNYT